MASTFGGNGDRRDKRILRQWLYKLNTQKPMVADYMFPSTTSEDKNSHYLIKFE